MTVLLSVKGSHDLSLIGRQLCPHGKKLAMIYQEHGYGSTIGKERQGHRT